jgi:hypothetical protein
MADRDSGKEKNSVDTTDNHKSLASENTYLPYKFASQILINQATSHIFIHFPRHKTANK